MNTETRTSAEAGANPEIREVPYAAPGGGPAPLTWSQQDMFRIMQALPGRHVHFNMTFSVRLPTGLSTERILDAVRDATESHEALRTTVAGAADGRPKQQVHATGRIRLRIHDFPRATDGDALAPDTLEAVADRGRSTPVGYPDEESYRPDLILVDGAPHTLVLTCNHLTMDGFSVPVLCEDLLGRLSESPVEITESVPWATGVAMMSPALPVRPTSPVPQSPRQRAEFEQSSDGSAQSERSLRALERAIRAAPPTLLRPPEDPAATGRAGFWWGRMRSPALAAAAADHERSPPKSSKAPRKAPEVTSSRKVMNSSWPWKTSTGRRSVLTTA
ncbi:condensation domain-containing protein [Streptomyces sp. 5.8]|uniref:condensation domain-containing protein n=1 Tax=Streptomyces sp. 5.8 TaxID=3406571 RepID=UPI003BB7121D